MSCPVCTEEGHDGCVTAYVNNELATLRELLAAETKRADANHRVRADYCVEVVSLNRQLAAEKAARENAEAQIAELLELTQSKEWAGRIKAEAERDAFKAKVEALEEALIEEWTIHDWTCPIARSLNKRYRGKPCNCNAEAQAAERIRKFFEVRR